MTVQQPKAQPAASNLTTIKVSMATRDRLKKLAQRDDCTLEQYVNKLIAMADREHRWDSLRASATAMSVGEWSEFSDEADPYVPDHEWNGLTVASEWQDEWDAQLARKGRSGDSIAREKAGE
jgi:hypothetical protein